MTGILDRINLRAYALLWYINRVFSNLIIKMINLYNKNGLTVRSEKEIQQRQIFEQYILSELKEGLAKVNNSFVFYQCEVSCLTPVELINQGYTTDDIFILGSDDTLALRPETTMWSYEYARYILNPHNSIKQRLPLVVRQHGKSYRNEQDKVSKNMRLKEFFQLEFQIIYSSSTQNDYHTLIVGIIHDCISKYFPVRVVDSDRLPDYSSKTTDIELITNGMELCSISQRKDFTTVGLSQAVEHHKVVEVAIGTDRLLYNFYNQ